jgi:hypothetical protein
VRLAWFAIEFEDAVGGALPGEVTYLIPEFEDLSCVLTPVD